MHHPPAMFPTWKAAGRYAWVLLLATLAAIIIELGAVFAVGWLIMEVIR